MTITINQFKLKNWKLEDKNGLVAVDTTTSSGKLDGFNIRVNSSGFHKGETWIDLEEAKSLRDWLNEIIPS